MATTEKNPIKIMLIIVIVLIVALIAFLVFAKQTTDDGTKIGYVGMAPATDPATTTTPATTPATTA
jgi:flagellar basal body-associated protein FliL